MGCRSETTGPRSVTCALAAVNHIDHVPTALVDPKTPMAPRLRWSKPVPRTGGPDPRTTGREWAAQRPSFSSLLDDGQEQIMRSDIVPGGKFPGI